MDKITPPETLKPPLGGGHLFFYFSTPNKLSDFNKKYNDLFFDLE